MKMDKVAQDRIIRLSRGLPFYVHTLAKYAAISATDDKRLVINRDDIDLAMDLFINETSQTFYEDYHAATASNQPGNLFREVLLACA